MKQISLLIPCLAFASLAHGSLLLQEDFNSLTAGDLQGQNGWTAVSDVDVAAGGLSYSSGTIVISGGANHSVWSGANVQPIASKGFTSQSAEVWFSLTIRVTATDTSSRFWFYVSDDADLGNSGVMGQINSGSQALLTAYRANSTQFASGNASLDVGNTLFLVGRFSQTGISSTVGDYDKMEMWVNPNSATLGAGANYFSATNVTGTGISTGIDTFAVTALGTGSTVLWDNLRVGTGQADVLDVHVVPEPNALLLLGLAGIFGIGVRRRNRR